MHIIYRGKRRTGYGSPFQIRVTSHLMSTYCTPLLFRCGRREDRVGIKFTSEIPFQVRTYNRILMNPWCTEQRFMLGITLVYLILICAILTSLSDALFGPFRRRIQSQSCPLRLQLYVRLEYNKRHTTYFTLAT